MAKTAQRGRRKGQINRKPNTVCASAAIVTRNPNDETKQTASTVIQYNDAAGNRMSAKLDLRVTKSGKLAVTVNEAELVSAAPEPDTDEA